MALLKNLKEIITDWTTVLLHWLHFWRSRRKGPDGAGGGLGGGAGKEGKAKADLKAESWDEGSGRPRVSPSGDFAVCELISAKDFAKLVAPPPGMDENEWLASHAVGLFHHVNALYGAVAELCSAESCPAMSTPTTSSLLWSDEKGRKTKLPAPQYIDAVMSQCQRLLDDVSQFPTSPSMAFPQAFPALVRRLTRGLWAVLGHVSLAHEPELLALGLGAQTAALQAHLHSFASHYNLLEAKEAAALANLVSKASTLGSGRRGAEEKETSSTSVDSSVPSDRALLLKASELRGGEGGSGSGGGGGGGSESGGDSASFSSQGGPENFRLACTANA